MSLNLYRSCFVAGTCQTLTLPRSQAMPSCVCKHRDCEPYQHGMLASHCHHMPAVPVSSLSEPLAMRAVWHLLTVSQLRMPAACRHHYHPPVMQPRPCRLHNGTTVSTWLIHYTHLYTLAVQRTAFPDCILPPRDLPCQPQGLSDFCGLCSARQVLLVGQD